MIHRTFLPSLLLASSALALPAKQTIKWGECKDKVPGVELQCAELPVPLDYTDPDSSATYPLRLMKAPVAKNTTSKGSLIFNFGGPGEASLEIFPTGVENLRKKIAGYDYDFVTFDPRGTANDSLYLDCYPDAEERARVFSPDPLARYVDESDTAIGSVWAEGKVRGETCLKNLKKKGELVGTSFVARDIARLVDALDQGPLINYYGVSYGTALGATLVSMFPDRVGRVILDSVENPHETGESLVYRTDAAFTALLKQCVEDGPSACPLAKHADNAADLEDKIYKFYDKLRTNPIPLPENLTTVDTTALSGRLIDYSGIKTLTFLSLYAPNNQITMLSGLDGVLSGNYSAYVDWRAVGGGMYATPNEAVYGIWCGDKVPRTSDINDIIPGIEKASNISRIAGASGPAYGIISPVCAQWPYEAKERYGGDFHVKTKNPVLLLGNQYDPATPIESAHNVSSGLEGSRVLELENSIGHGVHNSGSKCVYDAVQEFLNEGKLPKEKKCKIEPTVPGV